MKLAITICATTKYTYALATQANAVLNNLKEYKRLNPLFTFENDVLIVLVGSVNCAKTKKVAEFYKNSLNLCVRIISVKDSDDNKNYKTNAQLLISKLRTLAFNAAKFWGATHCWSLDSDVIPKANSLHCMENNLNFDDGYYSISSCVYPSQGGGLFLCGNGTYQDPICKDIYNDEKDVDPKILERVAEYEIKTKELNLLMKDAPNQETYNQWVRYSKKIAIWTRYIERKVRPKETNTFALNAKQWRKRGWFDFAYPAIGRGSVVPTSWMGFGCALINEKALNLIDFSGYEGRGTEDLFIIWNRWTPAGLKICALPHCPADHIIRKAKFDPKKDKKQKPEIEYKHVFTYHESTGECEGHLRQKQVKFVEFEL